MNSSYSKPFRYRPAITSLGAVVAVLLCGHAHAFEIDSGNPDLDIRWDNTVRYNLGIRGKSLDSNIGNSATNQLSDHRFRRAGDVVGNRIDLLSEFDLTYKKNTRFRVSGSAWNDAAYSGKAKFNLGIEPVSGLPYSQIGSYTNNQYSSYTKRYYAGPSGEILDAFAYTKFDLGSVIQGST